MQGAGVWGWQSSWNGEFQWAMGNGGRSEQKTAGTQLFILRPWAHRSWCCPVTILSKPLHTVLELSQWAQISWKLKTNLERRVCLWTHPSFSIGKKKNIPLIQFEFNYYPHFLPPPMDVRYWVEARVRLRLKLNSTTFIPTSFSTKVGGGSDYEEETSLNTEQPFKRHDSASVIWTFVFQLPCW